VTSTPRFVLWWTLASVPLPWVFERATEGLHRLGTAADAVGGGLILLIRVGIFAATATFQAGVLTRHRRPVPGWTAAVVVGQVLAWAAGYSLSRQFHQFVGSFGAVRLPSWWGWAFFAVLTTSTAFVLAVAQAVGLWGRRWPPAWRLWLGGRLALGLAIVLTLLAAESAGLRVLFHESFAVDGACRCVEAAGTAWLMDRLVFRPSASSRSPR
jgi:hypothetical protein